MEDVPRILIVDDDVALCNTLAEALSWNQGHEVEVAHDGEEALSKVATFHPHLVIHDLQLPGLDGVEVCRRIKANPLTRSIKVLAVTASPAPNARERVLNAGGDGFLLKPFQLVELESEVARLLRDLRGFVREPQRV